MRRPMVTVLISLALLIITAIPLSSQAPGQSAIAGAAITLIPGTVTVDDAVAAGVLQSLNASASLLPDIQYAAITAVSGQDGWLFVSVAGLRELTSDGHWSLLDNASWFGLVTLYRDAKGAWIGAPQDTPAFGPLMSRVPDNLLNPPARLDLATPSDLRRAAATAAYHFPWQTGLGMLYGPRGVHPADYASYFGIAGWVAVDMVSDGNTAAGHAPNSLRAAATGTISAVCNDGTSVAVRVDYNGSKQFLYAHLINNAHLYTGYTLQQGDEIGQLRTGSFNPVNGCGWANQGAGWFHVHWGFPTAPGSLTVDNWTLNLSGTANGLDNYVPWLGGGQAVYPDGYSWLMASAAVLPAPQLLSPAANEVQPAGYGVKFTWNPSDGATEYQIRWSGGPYSNTLPLGWFGGTSYDVGPVAPGTYTWQVRARNSAATGPWSATRTFTITALEVAGPLSISPDAPFQGLRATASFLVRNTLAQTVTLPALTVLARGPACQDWSCPDVLYFPPVTGLTLGAGQEYLYSQQLVFETEGMGYVATPAFLDTTGHWQPTLPGASSITFDVRPPLPIHVALPLLSVGG